MAVKNQTVTDKYAIYHGDCCEVMPKIPDASVHLSIYSPPFGGLYNYSSSERDMSNARSADEFYQHYEFLVKEIFRVTLPGRCSAVHCTDTQIGTKGDHEDLPGEIIRLHKRRGFYYVGRHHIFKEPLAVRNRTMARGLAHRQVVEDSNFCDMAHADYVLMFKKKGDNPIPVEHPRGLTEYAGETEIPSDLLHFRYWKGKHTENRYSHWIWRRYADAYWSDIRMGRILKYKEARDSEDERHVHPLQLDVIERCCVLRSNPGEVVLTPFMGVGSEVCGALANGRRAIGIELKDTYYRQAEKNIREVIESGLKHAEPELDLEGTAD